MLRKVSLVLSLILSLCIAFTVCNLNQSLIAAGGVTHTAESSPAFSLLSTTPEPIQEEEPEEAQEPTYSEEDLYWLAKAVSAESRGEPEEGQLAVANVILNRVQIPWYPDNIKDVVFQAGQFCVVADGQIDFEPVESALRAARLALEGARVLDDDVAFFYNHNKVGESHWIRSKTVFTIIGNHTFARTK